MSNSNNRSSASAAPSAEQFSFKPGYNQAFLDAGIVPKYRPPHMIDNYSDTSDDDSNDTLVTLTERFTVVDYTENFYFSDSSSDPWQEELPPLIGPIPTPTVAEGRNEMSYMPFHEMLREVQDQIVCTSNAPPPVGTEEHANDEASCPPASTVQHPSVSTSQSTMVRQDTIVHPSTVLPPSVTEETLPTAPQPPQPPRLSAETILSLLATMDKEVNNSVAINPTLLIPGRREELVRQRSAIVHNILVLAEPAELLRMMRLPKNMYENPRRLGPSK